MTTGSLQIAAIERRQDCQPRAAFDEATMLEYAEAMKAGDDFPPVKVVRAGDSFYLVDGFHRVAAAETAGLDRIRADVVEGTLRDAILLSRQVNATHGLRRTNEDKRRAVATLLEDPEWSQWSDREIARRCKVSHPLVATVRAELANTGKSSSVRTYTDRFGNTTTMDTSNIGQAEEEPTKDVDYKWPDELMNWQRENVKVMLGREEEDAVWRFHLGQADLLLLKTAQKIEHAGKQRRWVLNALFNEIASRIATAPAEELEPNEESERADPEPKPEPEPRQERKPSAWAPPLTPTAGPPDKGEDVDVSREPQFDDPDYDPGAAAERVLQIADVLAPRMFDVNTRVLVEVATGLARYILKLRDGEPEEEAKEPEPEPEPEPEQETQKVEEKPEPAPTQDPEAGSPPPFDVGTHVTWGGGLYGQIVNWAANGRIAYIAMQNGTQVKLPAFMLQAAG
jgi:hypothetical protein